MITTRLFGTTAAIASLAGLCAASAAAQSAQPIDIPAQALSDAITELGSETGLRIAANADAVAGKRSQAVQGPMTPTQALENLLAGTGLRAQSVARNAVVVSQAATSDPLPDAPFELAPIIVTGERVTRDLFETTSSVQVFGSEALEREPGITDVETTIGQAANVTVVNNSNQTPIIRGQSSAGPTTGAGAALSGTLPRANVTVDGRALSFNELAYAPSSLWDVEAIEVFRGPQTTAQGANSIAGAINVRTKNPVFDFEAALQAQYGSFDRGQVAAMINTPLSDSVALRATLEYQREEPYINFPLGLPDNSRADRTELLTGRVKLLWEPVSLPELSTMLTLSYTEFNRPQTQNVVNTPDSPWEDLNSNNINGYPSAFYGDTIAATHDISYDLGAGFSLRNQLVYSQTESTRFTGNPEDADFELPFNTDDLSNELILDYAPEGGALSGILGLYLRSTDERPTKGAPLQATDDKDGLGVFGEATYRFGNGVDITGGLRFQKNEQDRQVLYEPYNIEMDYSGSFEAWLPKLALGYEAREDLRLSFQVSKGFNPGGVTGPFRALAIGLPLEEPFREFDEETVINYEFALRGRFLEQRLFVAANLFYSDFDGYQYVIPFELPIGLLDSLVGNADKVEAYGAELEAVYDASDRLRVSGSLGLLESKIREFRENEAIEGNSTPFAPWLTLTLGLDYDVTDRFSLGGSLRHSAGYYSDVANTPEAKVDPITTLDLRGAYGFENGLELYGYINNVADVIKPTQIFADGRAGVTTRPREFGLGLRRVW